MSKTFPFLCNTFVLCSSLLDFVDYHIIVIMINYQYFTQCIDLNKEYFLKESLDILKILKQNIYTAFRNNQKYFHAYCQVLCSAFFHLITNSPHEKKIKMKTKKQTKIKSGTTINKFPRI